MADLTDAEIDRIEAGVLGTEGVAYGDDVLRLVAALRDDALAFDDLRSVNIERCQRWHPGYPDDEEWTLSDWGNAAAGEMGEACNAVKKIRRVTTGNPGANDPDLPTLTSRLAEEIADTVIYLDLLAAKAGIDLGAAVAGKFNAVSERESFPERLRARAALRQEGQR